jgi:hypothetical protein
MTYNVDHSFFSQPTERSFYWAGFLAADGNIDKGKPRITLALKSSDIEHLEKFKKDLQFKGEIKQISSFDNRQSFKSKIYYKSYLRFTSKKIVEDLNNQFLITPAKSKTLKFPSHLSNHPLIHHFVRGLIDGDGTIFYKLDLQRRENCASIFLCGTEGIVNSVDSIIFSNLNIRGEVKNKNGLYYLRYNGHEKLKKIINYLYFNCTIFLNRKMESAQKILNIKPKKIILDIEKLKELKDSESLNQLAKLFHCSKSTIVRRLLKLTTNILI